MSSDHGAGTVSLSHRAYRRLEDMIVTGELAPGAVLSESALAARLAVGRTPVREALQRLAREGLVTVLPRRGVIVPEINLARHFKLLELRRGLDRLVARWAAERADPGMRQRMRVVADEVEAAAAAGDERRFLKLAKEFHTLPSAACGNEYAENALSQLQGLARRFWFAHYRDYAGLSEAAALPGARLRAIASGDGDAAEAASDRLADYFEAFARATLRPPNRRRA
jgi:DNA-binding GntR family transcriptional regulator